MGNVHGRRTNEWRFAVGVRVNLRRAGFARKSKYDCYYYCARRPARDGHCAKMRPAETCSVPTILPSHIFEKKYKIIVLVRNGVCHSAVFRVKTVRVFYVFSLQ